jgi:hypothetical protein
MCQFRRYFVLTSDCLQGACTKVVVDMYIMNLQVWQKFVRQFIFGAYRDQVSGQFWILYCHVVKFYDTTLHHSASFFATWYTIQESKIVYAKQWINSPERKAMGRKDLSVNFGRRLVLEIWKEAVIQVGGPCGWRPLEEMFQVSPYMQKGRVAEGSVGAWSYTGYRWRTTREEDLYIVFSLSFFSFSYYLYWNIDLVHFPNHMLWLRVGLLFRVQWSWTITLIWVHYSWLLSNGGTYYIL